MRKMGIDYGTKRVGIALSEESGQMAFPYEVLENNDGLVKNIEAITAEKEVGQIIIGHSLDKSGEENVVHKGVKQLITDLTLATGLPIELEPEQYTTQEAIRFQGRTKKTDAAAAAIILNSYLNRQKND